uniref:Uncharacterized protein n=1 Tax=viral metagenome TaxID=1070528 RepID=A0A6C0HSP3_9ZZZZ
MDPNNNDINKNSNGVESTRSPEKVIESPKQESPKKSFFSYLNPFSNSETKVECINKCNKKYPTTIGGKKHRSKKNKNSKRKTRKSKSKKSKKSKK